MMFVSGETGEPSAETTSIIEEIVRQQVVEIVSVQPWLANSINRSTTNRILSSLNQTTQLYAVDLGASEL